jgi:hypothetical protein
VSLEATLSKAFVFFAFFVRTPFSDSQQRVKIFRCGALTAASELALLLI